MLLRACVGSILVIGIASALAGGLAASPPHGISVPAGYRIDVVAQGLNGPEGMAVVGAGQVAVVEAIDIGAPGVNPRLSLVSRGGHVRSLAAHDAGDKWVDVAGHPGRGFFVSSLGGPPAPGGIYRVDPNGEVTRLPAPGAHYISLAMDEVTGDLYSARLTFGGLNAIVKISQAGVVTAVRPDTRAQGLVVTPDRVLIASVQRRLVGAVFQATNEVIARDLVTGAESVLASSVGTLVGSLALAESGALYLTDFRDGQIRRLSPDSAGHYTVTTFATGLSDGSASYPAGPGQLSFNYLAFDPAGSLYVTDYGAGRVYRIIGRF